MILVNLRVCLPIHPQGERASAVRFFSFACGYLGMKENSLCRDSRSDAGAVLTYMLFAGFCIGDGWPVPENIVRSTAAVLFSPSLTTPLRDFNDHLFQSTYVKTQRKMTNTGNTTEGTIILIRLFPPLSLLAVLACEDGVNETEEEVGVDVGD